MLAWADPEGGHGVRTPPPPLKNHKNIGLLCNTGPVPLINKKATKPAFNVGPSSAHAFRWLVDDGPFIVVFESFTPPPPPPPINENKAFSNLDPSAKTSWIRACLD